LPCYAIAEWKTTTSHLLDAASANLVVMRDDRAQMKIADRAAGEAPVLKVDVIPIGSGTVIRWPEVVVRCSFGKTSATRALSSVPEVTGIELSFGG
jgi:hypothetical protein